MAAETGAEGVPEQLVSPTIAWDIVNAAAVFVWKGSPWPGRHGEGLAGWAGVLKASVLLTMLSAWLIFGFDGTFESLLGALAGVVGVGGLVLGVVGALAVESTLVPPARPGVPDDHPLVPPGEDKGAVSFAGLLVMQAPFSFAGLPVGVRMAAIPMAHGVALWSPIEATPARIEAVRALGEVRWILAPNVAHHLFLSQWLEAFPEARLIGVEGHDARRPELPWAEVHAAGDHFTVDELEVVVVPEGPAGHEMAVVHPMSGVLLLADLMFSMGHAPEARPWERLLLGLAGMAGRPGPMLEWKLREHEPGVKAALTQVRAWPFDHILLAHGRPVELEGRQAFEDGFRFLFDR